METVTHTPEWQSLLINILPLIFIGAIIVLIVFVIRYFLRIGKDTQEIRNLLEDNQ